MAIPGRMEQTPAASGKTRHSRHRITLATSGIVEGGEPTNVTVHNVSRTGMLIECQPSLPLGEIVAIDLPGSEATPAKVIWASDRLHGCEFLEPVSKALLSAAQLRSAVGPGLTVLEDGDSASGEPFGIRIQRLRKERGLSLAQIASHLAVSKPTVWAWEQGRARPAQERIELLAQALGTSSQALRTGRDEDGLREVLERSRRQIADAFGTAPDNVKIMIEL